MASAFNLPTQQLKGNYYLNTERNLIAGLIKTNSFAVT